MRHLPRLALWAVLIGVAPAIGGCSSFDPDSLDIFGLSEKKKLPGERRDLFPEGVPGVSQGIPPEYLRNNQVPAEGAAPQAAALPAEPAPPTAKPRPQPRRTATRAPARPAAAAPVTPVEAQPAPATTQQQAPASAWPAPQPSGTFQR